MQQTRQHLGLFLKLLPYKQGLSCLTPALISGFHHEANSTPASMMSSYPSRESDVRQAKYAFSQTAQSLTTGDRWSNSNGASWGAIFTGAATVATLSLILLIFGTGLGLSAALLWASKTISTQAFGVSPIIWITVTQLLASGIGESLVGRLRTKRVSASNDKIYFRDTTHGFLAWAIAVALRFEPNCRRFAKQNRAIG